MGPLLLRVAEQCFLDGELAESMKESITRLILKKSGDAKHLKNWRPISLLNVDYKIISKAITAQFLLVLFFLTFHFCTIFWTIIEMTRECAILVNLDQEKAFDRVDGSFLLDVL